MTSMRALGLLVALATAPRGAEAGEPLVIGFSMADSRHPLSVEMKRAAEAEAAALGVNLVTMDADYMAMMQPEHLFVLLERPVAGLLVNPVPGAALGEALEAAAAAHVPVVEVFAAPARAPARAVVGLDVPEGARLTARFLGERLGGKGDVLVLAVKGLEAEREAFARALQGSDVRIVATAEVVPGFQSAAKQAMAGLLREHPRFDALVATSDVLLLGAFEAMAEAGVDRAGKVTVTWTATPEVRRAITDGKLDAALDVRAGEQARQALRLVVEGLRSGKAPPSRFVPVAPKLITRAAPEG